MQLQQLSVFLENRPGQLFAPLRVLAEAGFNIVTLALADTREYGILRMIVADSEPARAALDEAGFVVNMAEVVALEAADEPGGLLAVFEHVDRDGLNIEYMYAVTCNSGRKAIVIRFNDAERAVAALQERGVRVLDHAAVFGG